MSMDAQQLMSINREEVDIVEEVRSAILSMAWLIIHTQSIHLSSLIGQRQRALA